MAACSLQIASSRTIFNKLDEVNRGIYFFKKYQELCSTEPGSTEEQFCQYNTGRFFSHIKAFRQAISCYEKVINDGREPGLTSQATLNLMIIYK